MNTGTPKLSDEQKIELGDEAERLLSPGSTFNKVVNHLIATNVALLMMEPIGSLTAQGHHASMKSLEDIRSSLSVLVAEAKKVRKV